MLRGPVISTRFPSTELHKIDRLAQRISDRINVERISQADMAQALLAKGFELAETREIKRDCFSASESGDLIRFALTDEESVRLDHLRSREKKTWPKLRTTPSHILRSLLRLALAEVETRVGFPAFSEAVLTLLNSRNAEANTDLEGDRKRRRPEATRRHHRSSPRAT